MIKIDEKLPVRNVLSNDCRNQKHRDNWKKHREVTLSASLEDDALLVPQYFRVFLSSLIAIVST
jgi:hypothetical protein